MTEVDIKFDVSHDVDIIEGRKTCTIRSKQLCQDGDLFRHRGKTYTVYGIQRQLAVSVVRDYYLEEACEDEVELWLLLKTYYPNLEPCSVVYRHRSRQLGPGDFNETTLLRSATHPGL